MRPVVQLVDGQSGTVLIARLQLAINFWSRFRGLQFASPLAEEEGLLLAPCRSVHTQFLRFPIDIYFCAFNGTVLSRKLNAKPWITVAANSDAQFVLETSTREMPLLEVGQKFLLSGDDAMGLSQHSHLASIIKL